MRNSVKTAVGSSLTPPYLNLACVDLTITSQPKCDVIVTMLRVPARLKILKFSAEKKRFIGTVMNHGKANCVLICPGSFAEAIWLTDQLSLHLSLQYYVYDLSLLKVSIMDSFHGKWFSIRSIPSWRTTVQCSCMQKADLCLIVTNHNRSADQYTVTSPDHSVALQKWLILPIWKSSMYISTQ